jgi:DHA2 family lincomycin resistance protein-like MFS transporter
MQETTEAAPAVPEDRAEDASFSPRDRLAISILLISTFVVILNETIMAVALPRLMADLQVSASAAQWLSTAFMLTMAVVIPVTGFLIQRMHTRPVFIMAMVAFSAGTLLCALAPGLNVLILGRIVQAVGTAIMMPLLMTTVMTLVPPAARGATMGKLSIVISVAPAIGPTISGIILDFLDWRWIFWIVLPIALAALAFGARRIPNVSEPRYAPVDVMSVPLAAIAFGGLVYGLNSLGEGAGHQGPISGELAVIVGVATMIVFVLRQLYLQKADRALLDFRTFRSPIFAVSVVMMAVCMMALLGVMILLPIYTQNVLDLSPLQTGLLLLPGGLVMGLMAPTVGRLYDTHGARRLIIPGAVLMTGVMAWLATVTQETPWFMVLAAHVVLSIGLGLLFTPLFTASLSAVPARLYSHGSAVLGTIQQVAGAAGTALFVALMSLRAADLARAGAEAHVALAGGVRLAFAWGACIAVFAIVAAFFVRRPVEEGRAHP